MNAEQLLNYAGTIGKVDSLIALLTNTKAIVNDRDEIARLIQEEANGDEIYRQGVIDVLRNEIPLL